MNIYIYNVYIYTDKYQYVNKSFAVRGFFVKERILVELYYVYNGMPVLGV